ncbi:MAG: hypothetical protein JGK15_21180 [Microcoleus sp. PH2017_33_LGB_O_A]|uniref:hypothetical protein n=1 Tax=Microcoleus sp. PH2017_33_LGB_O_A TaxID=2798843 RepID=UPI001DC04B67|nr:hypothetical protein [Microcoleus sp. PH2017_33_LGB_O_A]MCC3643135.1 hypothetical protein [Microcoleus sp. PH2017_33_LGB_O_A]
MKSAIFKMSIALDGRSQFIKTKEWMIVVGWAGEPVLSARALPPIPQICLSYLISIPNLRFEFRNRAGDRKFKLIFRIKPNTRFL